MINTTGIGLTRLSSATTACRRRSHHRHRHDRRSRHGGDGGAARPRDRAASCCSDVAPLNGLIRARAGSRRRLTAMKDPTRGGVASALHEMAAKGGVGIVLDERRCRCDRARGGRSWSASIRCSSPTRGRPDRRRRRRGRVLRGCAPIRSAARRDHRHVIDERPGCSSSHRVRPAAGRGAGRRSLAADMLTIIVRFASPSSARSVRPGCCPAPGRRCGAGRDRDRLRDHEPGNERGGSALASRA